MLRKDLEPGTVFRYIDGGFSKYWVPVSGQECPPGLLKSNANTANPDAAVFVISPKPAQDPVNYVDPAHYKSLTPEPIDVTEGWELNPNLASVVWYIARAGKKKHTGDAIKDAKLDLEKARRFLSREIARLDGRRSWD